MVPKIFSLKSMKFQLSKLVSKVVVRCLDPYLQLFELYKSSKMLPKIPIIQLLHSVVDFLQNFNQR